MLIPILIVLIIAVAISIVIFGLRLFKIERIEDIDEIGAANQEEALPEEPPPPELPDLAERVNLFDHFSDETEKKPPKKEEQPPTEYDSLCQLPVGRGYLRDCQTMLSQAKAEGDTYAVIRLDIDRFRFINSLKGFSIGDYVLSHLTTELQRIFPEGSLCSRISADHFSVLFPCDDTALLEDYADQIKRGVDKIRHDVGVKGEIRTCIGIALTDNGKYDYDINVLLEKANIARHCLKISKRERHGLYDDTMVSSYLFGESALDDYSENQYGDDFSLHFQPRSDMSKTQIIASTILPRWTSEDNSEREKSLDADSKLPTNNRKIIYHTCRAMSRWRKSGKEIIPAFVSLPSTELFLENIDSFLSKCLSEFQLEPSVLGLIISVNSIKLDWSVSSRQIKRLHEMGILVALEGVDKTVPDLSFLDSIQPDYIYLHPSLMKNIQREEERAEYLQKMSGMVQAVKSKPVYQGIDNMEQADVVRKMGGVLVEGRYAGWPLLPDEFGKSLPEKIEQKRSGTVILDDVALNHGEFTL